MESSAVILARALLFLLRNVKWDTRVACAEVNHHERALAKLAPDPPLRTP
jgi:hypothetical protein